MQEIDCFLVLGNENLMLSRKDCSDMIPLIKKQDKHTHVVMLINSSPNAKDEMWSG